MTAARTSGSTAGHVGTSFRSALETKWNRLVAKHEAGEDAGFTLAEVIVSIALFAVISFSVMFALVTLVKYTAVTQNRVAAANIARQEVERLRGENGTLSRLDLAPTTVTLKGTNYTVTPLLSPA